MIVLDLNAKISMAHLLLKSAFHNFSFIEGEVTTFNKYHIDGRLHKEFFDEEPDREYSGILFLGNPGKENPLKL